MIRVSRTAIGAVSLLLTACAGPVTGLEDAARPSLEQAQALLERGRAAEAEHLFEQLAKDPQTRPKALQGQGLAALAQGDGVRAEPLLRQAVTLVPGQWQAWNGLGIAYDGRRQWREAAEAYGKALALRPTSPVLANNFGYSLLLQHKPAEALTWLSTASRAEPRLPAAGTNLRLALAELGRYDDAVAEVTDEERAAALNNAGVVAMARGDKAQARQLLTRALAASPSYYERAQRNLERLGP